VLLLTPTAGSAQFARIRGARITPTFGDGPTILEWHRSGGGDWHLAIDTGMNRAGLRLDNMKCVTDLARVCPPAGAFTHYHSAELDNGSLEQQTQRFRDAVAQLPAAPPLLHAENSAAIERTSPSPWSFVRPGVFLYGVHSGGDITPEPVVSFRARVVDIHELRTGDTVSYDASWTASRPTRVATIAAGYADGYRRSLGNAGTILVNGQRVSVVGTVTMDMTMVDVTDVRCELGDVATLIGRDGEHTVTLADVATACRLSPYEILTGLRARPPRVYHS
jgi:alanine racemase